MSLILKSNGKIAVIDLGIKKNILDNFVKRDYDILINLCDSSCIPIKYLVAKSIARFKIGMYEENFDIYDLMIELKKEKSIQKLMDEIKHYINLINK